MVQIIESYVLQLFKNNDLLANLLVVIYLAFFGVGTWLYPTDNLSTFQEVPASLWYFVKDTLMESTPNKLIFIFLLLGQAYYLNYLLGIYKVARQYTTIPAVCFILLHFVSDTIDSCTPVIVANTFLILSLHAMLASYDKKASLGTIFNIGFWIGIAALFYNSHWVYIIWAIIGLLLIRTFDGQEFIIMLLGFAIPFFLAATLSFTFDSLAIWWQDYITIHSFSLQFMFEVNTAFWGLLLLLFTPYFLSVLNIGSLQFKTTTKEKKYINAILIMPLVGLFTLLFQNQIYLYHFATFIVPIGILFSLLVQSVKNNLWAELLHLAIFMACLGIQYQSFFFE